MRSGERERRRSSGLSGDGSRLGVVHHWYVEILRVSGSVGGESLNFLMLRR